MCDYSLMAFPNRLAACGEELISYRFRTGAKGFISILDVPQWSGPAVTVKDWLTRIWYLLRDQQCTAVCIPPGSHLLMRNLPASLQSQCGVMGELHEVTFTQTSIDTRFRDAVQFANGVELSVQKFAEGLRVKVLSVSSDDCSFPLENEESYWPNSAHDIFASWGGR